MAFHPAEQEVGKAIAPFLRANLHLSKQDAEKIAAELPFNDKRARELTPEQFGALANAIPC